jgi:hypothetical protein
MVHGLPPPMSRRHGWQADVWRNRQTSMLADQFFESKESNIIDAQRTFPSRSSRSELR